MTSDINQVTLYIEKKNPDYSFYVTYYNVFRNARNNVHVSLNHQRQNL